jgi:hypothetical protein
MGAVVNDQDAEMEAALALLDVKSLAWKTVSFEMKIFSKALTGNKAAADVDLGVDEAQYRQMLDASLWPQGAREVGRGADVESAAPGQAVDDPMAVKRLRPK